MKTLNVRALACALACAAAAVPAQAAVLSLAGFVNPTIIDFNDGNPANTQIGNTYAVQGVAFTNLCGGQTFKTGPAAGSEVASNFFAPGCSSQPYGPATISFGSTMTRVGFDITTNASDDTTVTAWLGNTLVGSEFFDTFGGGSDGSFAGVEFTGGFDRIEISAAPITNGAFSIDNLRFERGNAVPEPGTLVLAALGLAALRRRR